MAVQSVCPFLYKPARQGVMIFMGLGVRMAGCSYRDKKVQNRTQKTHKTEKVYYKVLLIYERIIGCR